MKLQVLVSTMNQKDQTLIDQMNIRTGAIIINQCSRDSMQVLETPHGAVIWVDQNGRGLSKSRNTALRLSKADIALIADDDVVYFDDYENIILSGYRQYPKADICAFYVRSTDESRSTSKPLKQRYISYINSMRLCSVMLSFKPGAITSAGISFHEQFGAGSGMYSMGEENIFLFHCLRKGLKIAYCDQTIGSVTNAQSTWWNGTFTEKLMRDKGAMFYEMSPGFSVFLILQYAIRKRHLYKNNMKFQEALRYMLLGKKEYASRIHTGRK